VSGDVAGIVGTNGSHGGRRRRVRRSVTSGSIGRPIMERRFTDRVGVGVVEKWHVQTSDSAGDNYDAHGEKTAHCHGVPTRRTSIPTKSASNRYSHFGLLDGMMVRASDLLSNDRGFDSRPGRYRAT